MTANNVEGQKNPRYEYQKDFIPRSNIGNGSRKLSALAVSPHTLPEAFFLQVFHHAKPKRGETRKWEVVNAAARNRALADWG
jgi:hypothetical protein